MAIKQIGVIHSAILVMCVLLFIQIAKADSMQDDLAFAKTQTAKIPAQISPYQLEISQLAQHAYQALQSPSVQADLHQAMSGSSQMVTNQQQVENPEIATKGDVLIFVSFSMPETSLEQWADQASRIHAPLVIRGLVDNSFKATQTRIKALMQDDSVKKIGVVLDPRLFTEYQITQVPAVLVRDRSVMCLPTQTCLTTYPYDVVYGNVGLESALTVIADQEDGAATTVAQKILATWQNMK